MSWITNRSCLLSSVSKISIIICKGFVTKVLRDGDENIHLIVAYTQQYVEVINSNLVVILQ